MRIASSMLLGSILAALPLALTSEPLTGGLAAVVAAIALAALVGGRLDAAALTSGALGALAYVAAAPVSMGLAGAALVGAAALPRSLRAVRVTSGALLVLLAFVGGGFGAWILAAFAAAELPYRAAAMVVAALLGGAFLWWPVDDVVGTRIRSRAAEERGAIRAQLMRAAALRRRWRRIEPQLGRGARRPVERAWTSLVLHLPRLATSPAARPAAERRLRAYVEALSRACRTAERALALDEPGDALVLSELRLAEEELDLRAEVLADVEAEHRALEP